ncbi:MAG: hypothetical protein U0X92_11110 [Anaerolineales bacterium]
MRDLNKVASAFVQVELTPTPLVMAVVLPSGHTPPDAQGKRGPTWRRFPNICGR